MAPSASAPTVATNADSEFTVEVLPLHVAVQQQESSRSLIRPLVTPSLDDDDIDEVVALPSASSRQHPDQLPHSELEEIKSIILTTLFSRLKSIRYLLLSHSSIINVGIHEFAAQLARRACSDPSCAERTGNGICTVDVDQSPLLLNFLPALRELKCLFWRTIESLVSIHRLQQKSSDSGQQNVCSRLVEMCYVLDFEPNFEKAIICEDIRGAIKVECQGFYYYEGDPIGPFRLHLVLIRNLQDSNQRPEVAEGIESAKGYYWCVRALIWECL